jgi:hypothetical protein
MRTEGGCDAGGVDGDYADWRGVISILGDRRGGLCREGGMVRRVLGAARVGAVVLAADLRWRAF